MITPTMEWFSTKEQLEGIKVDETNDFRLFDIDRVVKPIVENEIKDETNQNEIEEKRDDEESK
jgi:hypothetical protein